jgi:hypothetical protein
MGVCRYPITLSEWSRLLERICYHPALLNPVFSGTAKLLKKFLERREAVHSFTFGELVVFLFI